MSGILDHSLTIRRNFVNRLRTIAGMTLVVILAACGPAASGGSTEPDASEGQASQAQSSGGGPEPSFGEGVVGELEALIPDTVGDLTMQPETSMQGNEYLLDPDGDPSMLQFIQDVGVSPNDISMAIGSGSNADFSSTVVMFVIQAQGANSDALLDAFKQAMATDASPAPVWTSANVGGKQVQSSGDDFATSYVYTKGDDIFWIFATDPEIAAEILSGLP